MQLNDFKEINEKIKILKAAAQELQKMSDDFPALNRNVARIMSSIKMLEINVTDVLE